MSKKHFIKLADCLRSLRPHMVNNNETELALNAQWKDTVQTLADFCGQQNSRFNRSRWLSYIDGACGPNGGARKAA